MFRSRREYFLGSRSLNWKWSREKFWDRESNLFTVYKHVHNDTCSVVDSRGKGKEMARERQAGKEVARSGGSG